MKKSRVISILSLLIILLSIASTVTASASKNYQTRLSGDNEVPVRVTHAQGQAIFKLSEDGTELHYKLNVANIENIVQAHIHLAPVGQNGGVVAWLYPSAPPEPCCPLIPIPGRTNGTLAEGIITSSDLVGSLAGQPLQTLIDAIDAAGTYVNVHTSQYPGGEVRGQLHDH